MGYYSDKGIYPPLKKLPRKPLDSTPKPRTPADIGREIAKAQQRIVDLKAELADVPPKVLEFRYRYDSSDTRIVEFNAEHKPRIVVTRDDGVTAGSRIELSDVARLRAWLNHYYPEGS